MRRAPYIVRHAASIICFKWLLFLLVGCIGVTCRSEQLFQSKPEFYGDLVYRFRKIVGKYNFSEELRKLINRY